MKYVFFDIECACVYKSVAKICAFGYVVTDGEFRVLEREDILIDPKGKFHLTDRKGREGIVLPYAYVDFKKYPPFKAAYPKIKSLLEQKDALVIGHATLNDVKYLCLETKRFKLPSFDFEFYDTQFFYMNAQKSFSRQCGLETMAKDLGVEFTPHRAEDDAYATMRVCEALCKREGTNAEGLIDRYGIRAGKLSGYQIRNVDSDGLKHYSAEREEQKERQARLHREFYRFVNRQMNRRSIGGELEGHVFCFSKDLEEETAISLKLAGAIFAAGGKYTSHPADCNVFISREAGGVRYQCAIDSGAAFIPLEKFKSALKGV